MPETAIGYYYDWEKGFSTDPRFKDTGCPIGGKAVTQITVDGVDLKHPGTVRSCHSGLRGFVDHLLAAPEKTANGISGGYRSEKGEMAHELLFGEVEIFFNPECDSFYRQHADYRTPNCEDMV